VGYSAGEKLISATSRWKNQLGRATLIEWSQRNPPVPLSQNSPQLVYCLPVAHIAKGLHAIRVGACSSRKQYSN
jgi:hypothetical protein